MNVFLSMFASVKRQLFLWRRFSLWPALLLAAVALLVTRPPLLAQENWFAIEPRTSTFRQRFFDGEERIELKVPSSFAGRTAKEKRRVRGVELFDAARFERREGKVQLRGQVSVFDFDYQRDTLEFQVFRSRQARPGANSCMECHGTSMPRTTVIVGNRSTELKPKPVRRDNITFTIDPAEVVSSHGTLNHWLNRRLMLQGRVELGRINQGRHHLNAKAVTLGLAGIAGHRLLYDSHITVSKADTYRRRRNFTANLTYRFGKRLRFLLGGGIFLDGYTHFGTEMSEMGVMTIGLEKDDPELMPSIFDRLKNDKFGYLTSSLIYEYPF